MKIVVTNAVGRLSTGEELILYPSRWDSAVDGEAPFAYYPYELAYLSQVLKRDTVHDVKMLDPNWDLMDPSETADAILKEEPDLVITECSALTYPAMTEVARDVKAATGAKMWLTGPMATTQSDRCLVDGWDQTFGGEFEMKVLAGVLGPAGKTQGRPIGTSGLTAQYIDLDWLPFPEDDDISRLDYTEISNPVPGLVQVYPTRGCPLACTFCVVPIYYGLHGNSHKSHRQRDPNLVCDEIETLAEKYGTAFGGCFFNEEAHNANAEWFLKFTATLRARNLDEFVYDAMCGYWNFTEEMVASAAKAGYKQLRFGVESTAEQVGEAIHKTMHLDKLERFMGWCREYGVGAYGTFQIGAMGSTEATDRQTLEDLARWRETGLMQRWQVSTSTPQVGTPFYDLAKQNGWLVTEDLSRFNGMEAVVSYPEYSADRIAAVRALA